MSWTYDGVMAEVDYRRQRAEVSAVQHRLARQARQERRRARAQRRQQADTSVRIGQAYASLG